MNAFSVINSESTPNAGVAELADAPDSAALPNKTVSNDVAFAQPNIDALSLLPFLDESQNV